MRKIISSFLMWVFSLVEAVRTGKSGFNFSSPRALAIHGRNLYAGFGPSSGENAVISYNAGEFLTDDPEEVTVYTTTLTPDPAAPSTARTKLGYIGIELGARLALAEIEMKTGQTTAGRAHLTAIETAAKAKGYNLITRRVAIARG
jgi:hypothetical protein